MKFTKIATLVLCAMFGFSVAGYCGDVRWRNVGDEMWFATGDTDGDVFMRLTSSKQIIIPSGATLDAQTGSTTTIAGALSEDVDLANEVTGDLPFANLTQGSALSLLGVTGNATADHASIAAGSDHQVMRRSGTAVEFGAVALNQGAAITGTLPATNGGTGSIVFPHATANFDSGTSSDTITVAGMTSAAEVLIFPKSTTTAPAGVWTANPVSGAFEIYSWSDDNATSKVTQTASIAFMYLVLE